MSRALAVAAVLVAAAAFVGVNVVWFAAAWRARRGEVAEQAGDRDRAYLEFSRAGAINPRHAEYHRAAGDLKLLAPAGESRDAAVARLKAARGQYQAALAAEPFYPYHAFNLGRTLLALQEAGVRDGGSAEPWLKAALDLDPGNPAFLTEWVRWNLVAGKKGVALHAFAQLFALRPETIRRFGPRLFTEKDDVIIFGRTIHDQPRLHVELALFLLSNQRPELALAQLANVPDRALADPEVAVKLADVLVGVGRNEPAEVALRRSIEQNPANLTLCTRLVRILSGRGDYLGSVTAYEALVKRLPDPNGPLHLTIGWLAQKGGFAGKAAEHFKLAIDSGQLNPAGELDANLRLAQTLEALGQLEPALACYRRVLALDPNSKDAAYKIEILTIKQGLQRLDRDR